MKNIVLSLFAIIFSFSSFGQCYPGGIVGQRSVAVGNSVTLIDSGNWYAGPTSIIYGSSGTWSTSNAGIATIDSITGIVTGVSQGVVTISFTLSVSCASVAVRNLYVTSGTSGRLKICTGDTATLSNSHVGGSWSSSNPGVATINPASGLVAGISSGMAIISYNTVIGGVPQSLFDTLEVLSIASIGTLIGLTSVCADDTATISGTTSAVRWTTTDSTILPIYSRTDSTVVIRGWGAGSAKIIGTSLYCSSVSDSIIVQVHPLPDPGTILPNTLDMCLGATVTCTILGGDGYPGTWSTLSGYVGTIDPSGVFTAVIEGWEGAAYTVVSPYGCTATNYNYITTHWVPYLYDLITPASLTVGQSATLTCSSLVGTPATYTTAWASSPGTVASVSTTGVLTGFSVGTATVTYLATGMCGTNTLEAVVPITDPVIGGSCSSFTAFTNADCSSPVFGVSIPAHPASYQLRTYIGDGSSVIVTTIPASSVSALTTFPYTYSISGAYSIKQVLYNGGLPLDSVQYTYHHYLCHDISLSFYVDGNSNCNYDTSTEHLNMLPLVVEVARNGTVIDTVTATSGIYYPTMAIAGDVYAFRLVGTSAPLSISCPSSGIIYDTIFSAASGVVHKNVAVSCGSTTSGYDLSIVSSFRAGRHWGMGSMVVSNIGCIATVPSVVINIDPHYVFSSSVPAPSSVVGNTVTWSFPALSGTSEPQVISYSVDLAGTVWLLPGFPVMNVISASPTTGDSDTTNNHITRVDTVKSSFDPNHISVAPSGDILNGTLLHYTIQFENDGNDTAHNIFVLDTLDDRLMAATLRIEGASAAMNTTVLHSIGHTILKFEFPNIMLPDSSHHDQCTGIFAYSIKAATGLPDGSAILGHVGIYFDDNEVVLTDTAFNKIVVPQVSLAVSGSDSICDGMAVHFTATPHSVNVPHFQWYVNSMSAGTDSAGFVLPVAHVGDIIYCVMETIMDDTVYSTSTNIVLLSGGMPNAGTILGASSVCVGSDISLSETVTSGTWSVTNAHASITAGMLHGLSAGVDTVLYTISNICGTAVATYPVTINPLPIAGTITGATSVCPGSAITVSNTTTGGSWTLSNGNATHVGAVITGVTPGVDTVYYTVSNMCGSVAALHVITVNFSVTPAVSTTLFPGDTVCAGDSVTFTSVPVNGGVTPVYLWKRFGTIIGSGSTLHYLPVLGDVITCDMISSALCPTNDTVTSGSTTMVVVPVVTPTAVISTATDSISYAGQAVTINSTISYCGAGSYQWYRNGNLVPGATNATYTATVSTDDTFYCVNNCNTPCATTNTDTSNILIIYGDYLSLGVGSTHLVFSNLLLYPNPNNGLFTLSGNVGNLTNEDVHFDVLDMTGKVLFRGTTTPQNGIIDQRINMADGNIAAGKYMLRIVTGGGVEMLQFVIMK